MPEHLLDPDIIDDASPDPHRGSEALRLLSRSPHPYHRLRNELLQPLEQSRYESAEPSSTAYPPPPAAIGATAATSDSGTEADDEHFLKGLPAPRRMRKGLRGRNEVFSGTSTPLPSPSIQELEEKTLLSQSPGRKRETVGPSKLRPSLDASRRYKEIIRRLTEVALLGGLGYVVSRSNHVPPLWRKWERELCTSLGIAVGLALLYPARLWLWTHQRRSRSTGLPITIPSAFDPGPLLYPPAITFLVSSLISADNEAILLPNIILAFCSLPAALFPDIFPEHGYNYLQWALSCAPFLFSAKAEMASVISHHPNARNFSYRAIYEISVLLYPLHYHVTRALQALTTTSLLPAELQLLSVSLINVLLLSVSPQMVILKAVLWVGGLDLLVSCSHIVSWGISLARVPKWRFKRVLSPARCKSSFLSSVLPWKRVRHDLFHAPMDSSSCSSCEAFDDPDDSDDAIIRSSKSPLRVNTINFDGPEISRVKTGSSSLHNDSAQETRQRKVSDSHSGSRRQRRHTLSSFGQPLQKSHTHTPSGRKKRSASSSVRQFFTLTQEQAVIRKWVYAACVYFCILGALFVPLRPFGAMKLVAEEGLQGQEPIGWALGYMFGEIPWFRWQVVSNNLERWICLPARRESHLSGPAAMGLIENLRQNFLGEAGTRLAMCAYCVGVIAIGLVVVFRLSPFYEVDTRRKVFHFMMVAMFLPLTFIDSTFVAMALSIILALFLLLDLLRASQLPPLSKPLATFLAPYVDGRDLRGPVVISHIFLLIGCAIPLWLSMGSLPRTGVGHLQGWEVPVRETSMVAGIICVGLGDAAASLIGRRYGHKKWLWGGGKSIEGSIAFALAVVTGLLAASAWVRVGGWPTTTGETDGWGTTAQKAIVCGSLASLTEAVLTAGNDNVVVPVVLWTCVKSLGV